MAHELPVPGWLYGHEVDQLQLVGAGLFTDRNGIEVRLGDLVDTPRGQGHVSHLLFPPYSLQPPRLLVRLVADDQVAGFLLSQVTSAKT